MTAILSPPPCSHQLKSSDACRADSESRGNGGPFDGKDVFVVARCREIVAHYEEESENPENEMPRWLVEQLTEEEQEVAAQCSYAYWYLLQHSLKTTSAATVAVTKSARFATAMREAIRHRNCADNANDILKAFRATLDFHRTNQTTLYRTCMATKSGTGTNTTLSTQRRERIYDEIKKCQTNVVRGHDRDDRAIFFAFPRKIAGTLDDEAAVVDSLTYTMERAVAASEFESIGRQDQIVCVLDTKGGTCPPMKNCQAALGVLQNYYPGRLKTCVVLNPPYLVSALFKMVRPFMHPVTAEKFLLTKVKQQKSSKLDDDSILSRLIDESQAMPEMMPGRGKLTSKVDIDHYFYNVPFHRLYDYVSGGKEAATAAIPPLKLRRNILEEQPIDLMACSTASLSPSSSSPTSLSSDSGKRRFKFRRKNFGGRTVNVRIDTVKQKPKTIQRTDISVRSLAVGQLVIHDYPSSHASSSIREESGVVGFKINQTAAWIRGSPSVIG